MAEFPENTALPAAAESELFACETQRFKRAMWLVLALCLPVLACVFWYGDAPRPFVDRMNSMIAPVILVAFVILGSAMWRFRQRCGSWPRGVSQRPTSQQSS